MTERQDSSSRALVGATSLALIAAFSGWCGTAAASSAVTACNDTLTEVVSSELPTPSLKLKVVDHGMDDLKSKASQDKSAFSSRRLPDPLDLAPTESLQADDAHDVDVEPTATPVSDQGQASVSDAEGTATGENDLAEKPAVPVEGQLPAIATKVPGVSDDNLTRYRERMYRTDI